MPKALRDLVWRNYRPGQEIDKDPSGAWIQAAEAAIAAVAAREEAQRAKRQSGA